MGCSLVYVFVALIIISLAGLDIRRKTLRWDNPKILPLMLFAFVMHTADVLLTYEGMQLGYPEGNPMAACLIERYGFWRACLMLKIPAMLFTYSLIVQESYYAYWIIMAIGALIGPISWGVIIFSA
jgi:hypothetical protein